MYLYSIGEDNINCGTKHYIFYFEQLCIVFLRNKAHRIDKLQRDMIGLN
jgi:hypothetical protein